MTVTITPGAARAINAAADWLETNPDQHITATMATSTHGWRVPPTDAYATCFCALGRIAKEADITEQAQIGSGLSAYPYDAVIAWLSNNIDYPSGRRIANDIWQINDEGALDRDKRGNPDVIPFLRGLARGEFDA